MKIEKYKYKVFFIDQSLKSRQFHLKFYYTFSDVLILDASFQYFELSFCIVRTNETLKKSVDNWSQLSQFDRTWQALTLHQVHFSDTGVSFSNNHGTMMKSVTSTCLLFF